MVVTLVLTMLAKLRTNQTLNIYRVRRAAANSRWAPLGQPRSRATWISTGVSLKCLTLE